MGRKLKNTLDKKTFYIDEHGNMWQEGDVFQALSYKGIPFNYFYKIHSLYAVKQKDNKFIFRVLKIGCLYLYFLVSFNLGISLIRFMQRAPFF